jgi:C-terminal processing protease CtpA/Prc
MLLFLVCCFPPLYAFSLVEHFYPYKELMNEDWDGVLREFIPKFEQAKDALPYSLTVAEMMTRVHDSHAYVSGETINDYFGTGYPPIRVRMIENTLLVTHFYDEAAAKKAGLEIGDVISKVDGEDARVRVERYAKYISTSTPHNQIDKATLAFMNGKPGTNVTLTIRNRTNQVKEVQLPRKFEDYTTLYHRERRGDVVKILEGNIGYVDLDRLAQDQVDAMLDQLKNTRAIIFDMRGYPNSVFWTLPQRLTNKQNVAAALLATPLVRRIPVPNSSESFFQKIFPAEQGKWIYQGKTVMLIDERSLSQAEHTGLFFYAANETKFIGTHTGGANGELTTFSLPGGIGTGFTGQSVRFPNGKQLQRIGLDPDIAVKPTIKGIRPRRDEVLEAAVRYLGR